MAGTPGAVNAAVWQDKVPSRIAACSSPLHRSGASHEPHTAVDCQLHVPSQHWGSLVCTPKVPLFASYCCCWECRLPLRIARHHSPQSERLDSCCQGPRCSPIATWPVRHEKVLCVLPIFHAASWLTSALNAAGLAASLSPESLATAMLGTLLGRAWPAPDLRRSLPAPSMCPSI